MPFSNMPPNWSVTFMVSDVEANIKFSNKNDADFLEIVVTKVTKGFSSEIIWNGDKVGPIQETLIENIDRDFSLAELVILVCMSYYQIFIKQGDIELAKTMGFFIGQLQVKEPVYTILKDQEYIQIIDAFEN